MVLILQNVFNFDLPQSGKFNKIYSRSLNYISNIPVIIKTYLFYDWRSMGRLCNIFFIYETDFPKNGKS